MNHMEFPGGGDPFSAMLAHLDPSTEDGQGHVFKMADDLLRAERARAATLDGVRDLYESDDTDDATKKAEAALMFIATLAQAHQRYVDTIRGAMLELVTMMLDLAPGEAMDMAMTNATRQAAVNAIYQHPDFKEYVLDGKEPPEDGSPLDVLVSVEFRDDGYIRVAVQGDDREPIYFSPDLEFLGSEVPEQSPEQTAAGESEIDGIDSESVFDPDANGRQIRDFDGRTGD